MIRNTTAGALLPLLGDHVFLAMRKQVCDNSKIKMTLSKSRLVTSSRIRKKCSFVEFQKIKVLCSEAKTKKKST
jgi:hypothetical protein